MKRMICLMLAFCTLLSLSACSREQTDPKDDDSVDVEYYVKLGKMPECDYALGTGIDDLTDALSAASDADPDAEGDDDHQDEEAFTTLEYPDRIGISTGTFEYYYRPDREVDGVAYIVTYDTAYGFPIGTVTVEVEKLLSGFEAVKDNAKLFFLPSSGSFSTRTYTFGANAVIFVFENNALCATAVYSPALWEEL